MSFLSAASADGRPLGSKSRLPAALVGTLGALGILIIWLSALYNAGNLDGLLYLTPVLVVMIFFVMRGVFAVARGSEWALSGLLFLSMVILQLSFREREAGEAGLDLQSGLKLIFWFVMLLSALPYWRALLSLLQTSFSCRSALMFCAFAAVSVLWSAEPGVTAASGVGLFAALGFSFVLAIRMAAPKIHRIYFWALAIVVLLGCLFYFVDPSIAVLPPSEGEATYRLQGLSGHPNLLGQQAAILLLMAVALWEERSVSRSWLIAVGCVAAIALLFSESRTSLAALVVAIAFVRLRQAKLLNVTFLALIATATVLILLNATDLMPDVGDHLSGLTRSGSVSELTTFTGRTELWEISWERFLQKPWFGWGYNANERLMIDSVGPTFAGNAVNSHNLLLQALVTMGLVGTGVVLTFLGSMVYLMIVRPNPMRDRIFVFLFVLGTAEAEFLTLPVITIYLSFWAVADAAVAARRTSVASQA